MPDHFHALIRIRKGGHLALGDLASTEQRNRFVLEHAERRWIPHITPGGMLDRLVKEMHPQGNNIQPQKEN